MTKEQSTADATPFHLKGEPPSEWQPLEEHLKNVAEKARSFDDAFGAGEWRYLAGLWHDIGKYLQPCN